MYLCYTLVCLPSVGLYNHSHVKGYTWFKATTYLVVALSMIVGDILQVQTIAELALPGHQLWVDQTVMLQLCCLLVWSHIDYGCSIPVLVSAHWVLDSVDHSGFWLSKWAFCTRPTVSIYGKCGESLLDVWLFSMANGYADHLGSQPHHPGYPVMHQYPHCGAYQHCPRVPVHFGMQWLDTLDSLGGVSVSDAAQPSPSFATMDGPWAIKWLDVCSLPQVQYNCHSIPAGVWTPLLGIPW